MDFSVHVSNFILQSTYLIQVNIFDIPRDFTMQQKTKREYRQGYSLWSLSL